MNNYMANPSIEIKIDDETMYLNQKLKENIIMELNTKAKKYPGYYVANYVDKEKMDYDKVFTFSHNFELEDNPANRIECNGPTCGWSKCKLCFPCSNINCNKCGDNAKEVGQIQDMVKANLKLIKSAKAKSVYALSGSASFYSGGSVPPYAVVPQNKLLLYPTLHDEEKVKDFLTSGEQIFARPCPLNPVHGFVDSRSINTYNQFLALVDEVDRKKGNDILEILLMPVIKANYSAIVTPRSVTLGKGNDGATAGRDSIVINTPISIITGVVKSKVVQEFVKEGEVPFVELVHGSLGKSGSVGTWVVQVRSGHQPDGLSSDYIPKDVVVKRLHTVTPETDLLEWKTKVEKFSDGDVIYAPSMSCHGAVHGVANKIPVVTSHVPEIGEKLVAGTILPPNAERVAILLKYLLKSKDSIDYNRVLYGWKFAHTLAVNNIAGGEEVIAYSIYNLIMGGVAACLGEYRHARGKKLKGFGKGRGRSQIFKDTFENKKRGFSVIHNVLHAFLSPRFSGGFGGKPWAECASATIELQRAAVAIIRNPNEENVNKAIIAANNLAHAQHNGGILFNKFGSTTESITDLVGQQEVVKRLLELLTVTKSTINKTLLATMEKKTPAKTLEMWDSWEEKKKKQLEKEAKQELILKKQQEKMMLELEKAKKLYEEKYGNLSLAEKLMLPETKAQIRPLETGYFRLQIKVAGKFLEYQIKTKDKEFVLPKPANCKSWAGTQMKYVKTKIKSVIAANASKNDKKYGIFELTLGFAGGTEVATESVEISIPSF
jgi:hypothetical protein